MAQIFKTYSEKDIKAIVSKEFSKRFHALEVLINSLHLRVVDLDKIIENKIRK
jgi:hypothetical protein